MKNKIPNNNSSILNPLFGEDIFQIIQCVSVTKLMKCVDVPTRGDPTVIRPLHFKVKTNERNLLNIQT